MPKDFRKDVGRISQKDLVEKYSCQGTGDSTGLNRSLRQAIFYIQPINTGQLVGGFNNILAEDFMCFVFWNFCTFWG